VRRLLAPIAAAAAAVGLLRLLSRRRRSAPEVVDDPPGLDSRAEELRRKLAESRGVADDREAWSSGEVPVDEAEPVPADPDKRRRRVHDEGRSAAERMRSSSD
jgi:hypothetical protein